MGIVVIGGGGGGGGVGPQGPQGERGFGAFEWSADRVGAQQYKIGEVVFYDGQHYICIADNDAIVPTSAVGVYWNPYSLVGPQGEPGPGADQPLNTTDSVTFGGITTGSFTAGVNGTPVTFHNNIGFVPGSQHGIIFGDGTVQTTAYTGSPYDQSLNTTDSVAFAGVETASLQSGISGPVQIDSDVSIPNHGISFADGKRQTVACPLYREHEGSRTYEGGDVVVYDGAMYRCNSPGQYQNSAPPTMDGTWVAISGPPGPAGNPFDQNLNTTDSPAFTAVSIGNVNTLSGSSSIGFNANIALNSGVGIVFPDGSTQTTAYTGGGGSSLPDVNSHGYTLLWNPAGSPGWTWSADVWNTLAKVTWAEPAYNYMDTPTLTVSRPAHGATSVTPYGIKFPDGTVQTTAGGGGGGAAAGTDAVGVWKTGVTVAVDDIWYYNGALYKVINQFAGQYAPDFDPNYWQPVLTGGGGGGTPVLGGEPPTFGSRFSYNDSYWGTGGVDTLVFHGSGGDFPWATQTRINAFGIVAPYISAENGQGATMRAWHTGLNAGCALAWNGLSIMDWGGAVPWCIKPADDYTPQLVMQSPTGTVFAFHGVTGRATFPALTLTGLATSDPNVAGVVWNDNGTLKVSAG